MLAEYLIERRISQSGKNVKTRWKGHKGKLCDMWEKSKREMR